MRNVFYSAFTDEKYFWYGTASQHVKKSHHSSPASQDNSNNISDGALLSIVINRSDEF